MCGGLRVEMRGRVVLTSRSLSEENLKKKNEIQGVKFRDETFALVFYSVVAALRKWKSGKKKKKNEIRGVRYCDKNLTWAFDIFSWANKSKP